MSMSNEHRTETNDLVAEIQDVLRGHKVIQSVEALALTMISLGCKLNNISGEITPDVLHNIDSRYHTLGQANIADALILQGYVMLSWGTSPDNETTETQED